MTLSRWLAATLPQVWSWPNRTGSTTITYIAPLKKFVMVVDAPGVKPQTPGQSMGVSHLCGLIRRCASLLTSADLSLASDEFRYQILLSLVCFCVGSDLVSSAGTPLHY